MWLLGDDDDIAPDAVETIFSELKEAKDAVYINFKAMPTATRTSAYATKGLDDFVNRLDCFSNLLFMSTGVYNTAFFKNKLKMGYHYSYSFAVHLVLIFSSLQLDSECIFSPKTLTGHGTSNMPEEMPDYKMWNWLSLGMGIPLLFELPIGKRARLKLADMYYSTVPVMGHCIWQLIEMASDAPSEARYLFDQFCGRNSLYFKGHPTRQAKRLAWKLMVAFPSLGRRAASKYIRIKTGQQMTGEGIADRFERM